MISLFKITCALTIFTFQFVYGRHINCKSSSLNKCQTNDDPLIFAHTLCRHGARNAYIFYPNDPWKDEKYWPGGNAQLTNVGRQEHYELGNYFRKRYANLLGSGYYSPYKVYVQSTDVDRTLASALSALSGLFPPKANETWNDRIKWQPIPVHTQPKKDDYLLAAEKRCDRFDYVMLDYMKGPEYKSFFTKYASLISYLEKYSGMKLPTITDILNLYDLFEVELFQNKRLPDFARKVMFPNSDFEHIALYWLRMFTATTPMKKLRSGYLLKEILDRFNNKTQSTLDPDRSLWMYFAHDITLSNMLNTLGVFNGLQPPFASCILFELHQGHDNPYVQLYFRNNTDTNIPPLNIPGCGTKCPLHKMYELYDNVLPTKSNDVACTLRKGESLPPGGNPENNAL